MKKLTKIEVKKIPEFNDVHRELRGHMFTKCADRDFYFCTLCDFEVPGNKIRLLSEGSLKNYWKKQIGNIRDKNKLT